MDNGNTTGFALIGMGPGKVESMTLEAVEVAKKADIRLYEAYTALWPEDELLKLEEMIGPLERIMRPAVENPEILFEQAKSKLVAILVVGDPMQATTHIDFQLRAEQEGIPVTNHPWHFSYHARTRCNRIVRLQIWALNHVDVPVRELDSHVST